MKYLKFSLPRFGNKPSVALTSATQHAMPEEFAVIWGTKVSYCYGYSVKTASRGNEIDSIPRYEKCKNHTEMMQTPIPVISIQPYAAVKEPLEDVVEPTEQTPLVQEHHALEELSSTDRLLITKRSSVRNVVFLRGKKNRFFVRTPEQNLIYTIEEQNSWWMGYFCYGLRPLQLHVKDNEGVEVMRIDRPFACTSRILPCQLQRIQVFAPPETPIGSIEQQWTPVRPEYIVKREDGEQIFWVKGPSVTISCFNDIQFQIYKRDGATVGSTCKRWQGLVHAMFLAPITDRFGVAFERDLSVTEKALLLATTIILDYMYYDV